MERRVGREIINASVLREANDAEIWRYAVQQQAAIITKDEDFAERCLTAETSQ
jgi:predicted nuclease of predicted toxin-antitoxin system